MTSRSNETTSSTSGTCPADTSEPIAVLLDLDGTLLELAPRPGDVVVPQGLPALLHDLQTRLQGALAIVSGRPIASIDALLAPFQSAAAGLHGTQLRLTSNAPIVATVLATSPHAVIERTTTLRTQSVLLEDKGACVAIHHRFPADVLDAVKAEIHAVMARHAPDLDLLEGRCVLEIKPRAIDKGVACRMLLESAPFGARKLVYFGDDVTDVAAFRFVDTAGGTSVAVGPRVAHEARVRMSGPAEVLAWLAALRDSLCRTRSAP